MADDIDFDIPAADDIAKEAQKTLEARIAETSSVVRDALEHARTTGKWPAEISSKAIPEPLREPLYSYLTKQKYNVDRQTEHWYLSKPET